MSPRLAAMCLTFAFAGCAHATANTPESESVPPAPYKPGALDENRVERGELTEKRCQWLSQQVPGMFPEEDTPAAGDVSYFLCGSLVFQLGTTPRRKVTPREMGDVCEKAGCYVTSMYGGDFACRLFLGKHAQVKQEPPLEHDQAYHGCIEVTFGYLGGEYSVISGGPVFHVDLKDILDKKQGESGKPSSPPP